MTFLSVLKIVLCVLLIIVCVALTVIILFQESKQNGLAGSLSGQASTDTFWQKNKGRSKEGILVKVSIALVVLFFVLSIVLNIGSF